MSSEGSSPLGNTTSGTSPESLALQEPHEMKKLPRLIQNQIQDISHLHLSEDAGRPHGKSSGRNQRPTGGLAASVLSKASWPLWSFDPNFQQDILDP